MGGDLNLKKSWHPVLMSNQKRVWEEEKKALEERKRTEQRIKELKEERAKEEIQSKLEAAGSRKRVDRVDWMYQSPANGQIGTTEEMEGYLLGKRRIDHLIKGDEKQMLEKQGFENSFLTSHSVNSVRDTNAKIREDPLLAIKRQEQAAYEAVMNDPLKRRQLLALAGQDVGKKEKDYKSSKSQHRHRHHKHLEENRKHQKRQRDSRDDYKSERSDYRCKSARSRSYAQTEDRRKESSQSSYKSKDAERQQRLEEMQKDASKLDLDREKRLAALEKQEKLEREAEDRARLKSTRYGGKGDFINKIHMKAGDMSLADRIGRSRQGMIKVNDN
ncbi:Pre-mRNA-splicing factor CWC25 [Erysiphe neolycopersici]|uniref:Pre-mRNA-splicing factor CWC25 n=1 Tax=Erysiphe neolycopersici TaxID=212602 RepID=A0A420HE36_9PEZI|nr:Pre-mRNA-splicing factor CWC25 [Erysiphe neolycopersici]